MQSDTSLMPLINSLSNSLPNYVHLHTAEEIRETEFINVNKPDLCKNSTDQHLLIAVKTAPDHLEQRDLIRSSWLNGTKVPHVFVLGMTTDKELLKEIIEEDRVHQDLIIG